MREATRSKIGVSSMGRHAGALSQVQVRLAQAQAAGVQRSGLSSAPLTVLQSSRTGIPSRMPSSRQV